MFCNQEDFNFPNWCDRTDCGCERECKSTTNVKWGEDQARTLDFLLILSHGYSDFIVLHVIFFNQQALQNVTFNGGVPDNALK